MSEPIIAFFYGIMYLVASGMILFFVPFLIAWGIRKGLSMVPKNVNHYYISKKEDSRE